MSSVLVTGASGTVGKAVVNALVAQGSHVVAARHGEPSKVERDEPNFASHVTSVRLDFYDPSTWRGCIQGARHLFLMRPPAIADVKKTLHPFVDFARAEGVDHVVFLSVAGAEKNRWVPHRGVEEHLRSRGDHYTCLRPGFFAQNLETAYRRDIAVDSRIYVPAGHAPVNWIDVRDIADVAAMVLAHPEQHRGQCYTLAGPGPVSWESVADSLHIALGRPIRYVPASVAGYAWHLWRQGLPWGAIAVQTALHVLLRFGQGAIVGPTLETLLGRPARRVTDYILEHADVWAANGAPATAVIPV